MHRLTTHLACNITYICRKKITRFCSCFWTVKYLFTHCEIPILAQLLWYGWSFVMKIKKQIFMRWGCVPMGNKFIGYWMFTHLKQNLMWNGLMRGFLVCFLPTRKMRLFLQTWQINCYFTDPQEISIWGWTGGGVGGRDIDKFSVHYLHQPMHNFISSHSYWTR